VLANAAAVRAQLVATHRQVMEWKKAMNLLGTLRLDGKLSVAVFNDRFRMYRDLLGNVARHAIDDILAAP
jgi:hypothetical protein